MAQRPVVIMLNPEFVKREGGVVVTVTGLVLGTMQHPNLPVRTLLLGKAGGKILINPPLGIAKASDGNAGPVAQGQVLSADGGAEDADVAGKSICWSVPVCVVHRTGKRGCPPPLDVAAGPRKSIAAMLFCSRSKTSPTISIKSTSSSIATVTIFLSRELREPVARAGAGCLLAPNGLAKCKSAVWINL